MSLWLIDSVVFRHPFTCCIAGPTGCGKTKFLHDVLMYKDDLISQTPDIIIYCYKEWQPIYDQFKSVNKNIIFIEGLININDYDKEANKIIIFDDLMKECLESIHVMNIFTVGSHHYNSSVFFLTQNIYSKGKFSRDISLNTHYLILFKNPRDKLQISFLARQMYPGKSKFLIEAYDDSTEKPYGYLFIDMRQETLTKNRIQTDILPNQKKIIYTLKK